MPRLSKYTVQNLIDRLSLVEDKSAYVFIQEKSGDIAHLNEVSLDFSESGLDELTERGFHPLLRS